MFWNASVHLRSETFFKGIIEYQTIFLIKMKTPGPSHRIDDELKAPGSLWSKSLKQVSIVLIQAVWQQERQFFQLLAV